MFIYHFHNISSFLCYEAKCLNLLSDHIIDTTIHDAETQQDIGGMSVAAKLMVCSRAIYFLVPKCCWPIQNDAKNLENDLNSSDSAQ